MKLKSLLLGVTGFALLGTSAFAQDNANELRIVGSTAFRAPVTKAIINALGGSGNVSVCYSGSAASNSGSSSGLFGASAAYFVNSAGTIVKTYWTGSLAGVVDLTTGTFNNASSSAGFLPDGVISYGAANTTYTDATSFNSNGTSVGGSYGTVVTNPSPDTTAPNLAMSDSYRSSVATSLSSAKIKSPYVGTYHTIASLTTAISTGPLVAAGTGVDASADRVGIVPFEWCVGNTTNTTAGTFNNITQSQALALIEQGSIPMMFLTGNSSDSTSFAYLVGRNEDSGTRIGAFAESQYGFGASPLQWIMSFTAFGTNSLTTGTSSYSTNIYTGGSGSTLSGGSPWNSSYALNTEPAIYWSASGHSGYTSGGDVANVLSSTNTISTNGSTALSGGPSENTGAAYLIGYLGFSDAFSINNGTVLEYNGVAPSITGIQTGAYTFWTFEHCYYVSSGSNALNSTQIGTANSIADLIYSTYSDTTKYGQTAVNPPSTGPAPAGVLISTAPVTHGISGTEGTFINYTY